MLVVTLTRGIWRIGAWHPKVEDRWTRFMFDCDLNFERYTWDDTLAT